MVYFLFFGFFFFFVSCIDLLEVVWRVARIWSLAEVERISLHFCMENMLVCATSTYSSVGAGDELSVLTESQLCFLSPHKWIWGFGFLFCYRVQCEVKDHSYALCTFTCYKFVYLICCKSGIPHNVCILLQSTISSWCNSRHKSKLYSCDLNL